MLSNIEYKTIQSGAVQSFKQQEECFTLRLPNSIVHAISKAVSVTIKLPKKRDDFQLNGGKLFVDEQSFDVAIGKESNIKVKW